MNADWQSLYPFKSHFVDRGSARLHYLDEGQGPVLLMVHGNPTWSFYFRHLVSAFRDDYRVVVPDHMGCGLSDKPPDYCYTLSQRIDDLVQLIEQLDLRQITLVVHDWGGAIGLGAAERVPNRVGRIVLLNTGAFPPPYVPWRILACRLPLIGSLAIRQGNLFARAALSMAVEHPRRMTPAVRAGLLAPYDSPANRVAIDEFVRDIPLTRRHPAYQELRVIEAGLPFLANRPIQIIWGMKDWCFTSVCLDRFCRVFPRAEVHRLEHAGHYVLEDAWEEVVGHMRPFLGRTNPLVASMAEPRPEGKLDVH
jgi:cis-3-alkyl-4-acyloxetan-2-one decarboxylase